MSIDDLARSAAEAVRDTAMSTYDIDGGLTRIPQASRRRSLARTGAAVVSVLLVLLAGVFAVRPHLGAIPEPVDSSSPTPSEPARHPPHRRQDRSTPWSCEARRSWRSTGPAPCTGPGT